MSWFPTGPLTVPRACLWVALIWAGIYLPALGALELKHEEPRRALPAVRMLATGDWLVPRVGSHAYLRKPPLLNWLIALSFRLSGGWSEWAARLPSVLATLALALTVAAVAGRSWLGAEGGLLAAIFCLTNLALMEIGRLAELEALYLALTGIALTLWLVTWLQGANSWRLWLLPAPFLALAMLTKGPTHLIFYYGIIVPVLVLGKDARALRHPAHWLALVLVVGGFLSWAIPCSFAVGEHSPAGVWQVWWREIASRAGGPEEAHFHLSTWLLAVPLGLKNFLPWTVLLPLLWHPAVGARLGALSASHPRERAVFLGARVGMVGVFLLLSLLPKGSPRYVYPLLIVPCLLLARVMTLPAEVGAINGPRWLPVVWSRVNAAVLIGFVLATVTVLAITRGEGWLPRAMTLGLLLAASSLLVLTLRLKTDPLAPGWLSLVFPVRHALTSAAVMVLVTLIYAVVAAPRINTAKTTGPREVATAIRAAVPPQTPLWIEDDGYCPFWFYLGSGVTYFRKPSELPAEARFLLLPAARVPALAFSESGPPLPVVRATVRDGQQKEFVVLERPPSPPGLP